MKSDLPAVAPVAFVPRTRIPDRGAVLRQGLVPAVRFLRIVAGVDALGLLGRAVSLAQVRDLGGEPRGASVVVGAASYDVEAGYLAGSPPAAPSLPSNPGPVPAVQEVRRVLPPQLEERRNEAEALARFLLDNLS